MGVTQHTCGTDNAHALVNLALATGQVGKPGSGISPLRGQNNVQGCGDAGCLPDQLPGYQGLGDGHRRASSPARGAASCRGAPGLHATEMFEEAAAGPPRLHVRHRREPAAQRAVPRAREGGDRAAEVPRRAGHLHDRDRRARRRGAAVDVVRREGRHVHEQRASRPARAAGDRARRRQPARLGDHLRPRDARRAAARPAERTASTSESPAAIFDELASLAPSMRRHLARAPRPRGRHPVAVPGAGPSGHAAALRRDVPARPRTLRAGRRRARPPPSCRAAASRTSSTPAASSTTGTAAR